MLVRAAHSHRG